MGQQFGWDSVVVIDLKAIDGTELEMVDDLHVELCSAVVPCFVLLSLWPALINTHESCIIILMIYVTITYTVHV